MSLRFPYRDKMICLLCPVSALDMICVQICNSCHCMEPSRWWVPVSIPDYIMLLKSSSVSFSKPITPDTYPNMSQASNILVLNVIYCKSHSNKGSFDTDQHRVLTVANWPDGRRFWPHFQLLANITDEPWWNTQTAVDTSGPIPINYPKNKNAGDWIHTHRFNFD